MFGCRIVGPYRTLAQAINSARHEEFDLAVLDINLRGEMVFPLADQLRDGGLPFLFLSGYGLANLPERFRSVPRVGKPYDPAILAREMRHALCSANPPEM